MCCPSFYWHGRKGPAITKPQAGHAWTEKRRALARANPGTPRSGECAGLRKAGLLSAEHGADKEGSIVTASRLRQSMAVFTSMSRKCGLKTMTGKEQSYG